MSEEIERLYTVQEVAKLVGVKDKTLRAWIQSKKVHAVRTVGGRAWRISSSEVRRLTSVDV